MSDKTPEEIKAEANRCIDHIDDYFVSSGTCKSAAISSLVYLLLKAFASNGVTHEQVALAFQELLEVYDKT
jgi:hypothetical protein